MGNVKIPLDVYKRQVQRTDAKKEIYTSLSRTLLQNDYWNQNKH